MRDRLLLIDIDRCIRCYACELACKQEHDLPAGPRWSQVLTVEPRRIGGELYTDFVFFTCVQCEDPVCACVCPSEAISKREDGIVLVDEARCKGCGFCVHACPFGAIELDPEKKLAWKCSLCFDRTDQDLPPSCVQHCAGGALQYVTEEELREIAAGRHSARIGRVCYLSATWKLSV